MPFTKYTGLAAAINNRGLRVVRLQHRGWLVCLLLLWLGAVQADEARQFIGYWKPYVIAPESDPQVARAQRVFANLLRAWDGTRVEPSLQVVDSKQGPWAASLADGNILLSREAIDICRAQGEAQADHLLAFVLAHELAHQRADDLWHYKFFRLVGNQPPAAQQRMLAGLQLDDQSLPDLERREAQADHEGLILMATVGYDPFVVVDRKDFFTRWVESLWQAPCAAAQGHAREACAQARTRAARARVQLASVATQATLFELGVQAFAAGRYEAARHYFTAFGRDYPSRAVHINIGLSHFAQALQLRRNLMAEGLVSGPRFYFPLLLETDPQAMPAAVSGQVRGQQDGAAERRLMKQHISHAAEAFERAIRLEPAYANSYLLLGMAYLMDGNTYMARGVIQGKYIPRFGTDAAARLLLAMTQVLEGDTQGATKAFDALVAELKETPQAASPWPADLLLYAVSYNTAAVARLRGEPAAADNYWRQIAAAARRQGRGMLFRLALARLGPSATGTAAELAPPLVHGVRLGDSAAVPPRKGSEFWLEGEALTLYRFADGARWVLDAKGRVVNAWQSHGSAQQVGGVAIGDSADRPLKVYGLPARRIELGSGAYLAYDALGMAFHIEDGRVAGWFLYRPDG
jgi:tetratricopeptide (TPR) repeat protein